MTLEDKDWHFQKYVPLHCHTHMSLLDGYQTVEEYAKICEGLHVKAAAITDHGTCSGHETFDLAVIQNKYHFKPIFGEEAYLVDDVDNIMSDRVARDRKGNIKYDAETGEPEMAKQKPSDFNHGCIWAKTDEGLSNLWKLSTLSYVKGMYYKPRIDMKMLKEYGRGLFVSDGCMLSKVSRSIVKGDINAAYEWEQKLIDAVGRDNVLVELHTWQFTDEKYSASLEDFDHDSLKALIKKVKDSGIALKSMRDLQDLHDWTSQFSKKTRGKKVIPDIEVVRAFEDLEDEDKKAIASAYSSYDSEIRNWHLNHDMYKTNIEKLKIAKKLGLKTIAVNDAHYGPREDYVWHELEWATTTGKGAEYNDDKTEGRGETAAWVMNDEEVKYWLLKTGLPEDAVDEAIANTGWVADQCNATIQRGMFPPRFASSREKDEKIFEQTVKAGFKELVPKDKMSEYMKQLNIEVELIKKCDLCGYFNTVADYANFVRADDEDGSKYGIVGKKASLLGPGRGSSAGSLVCYLMHIVNLDPIKFGLFFERFLTAGRVISKVHLDFEDRTSKAFNPSDVVKTEEGDKNAWQCLSESWDTEYGKIADSRFDFKDCPDIDLDFSAEVIPSLNAYLKKRYGEYGVSQIGTYGLLKSSMAIRDIMKVEGKDNAEAQEIINRLSATDWDMSYQFDWVTKEEFFSHIENSKDDLLLKLLDEGFWEKVWSWGGRFRNEGIHASGYVVSGESMFGKMPFRVKDGKLITQFEHFGVARMGFIKYDILKLSSLDTIKESYERVFGKLDVKKVYSMMRDEKLLSAKGLWDSTWKGDTLGIFQMDTSLGTRTSVNARITSLRDAGLLSAVDRPGMVRSGLIEEFYDIRKGLKPKNTYHPMIDPILDESDGFVVYQEQIMSIYRVICNMTAEETDGVRKVFTKKRTDLVEGMKQKLHDSCMNSKEFVNNVPSKYKDAEECFDDMWYGLSRTAEYTFNKAHGQSYGEITSIEQWFKVNHVNEFLTASLNTDPGKTEFLSYARMHGLEVSVPNVNNSSSRYECVDGAISL